ncbi:hypothetical protein [Halalkalibaculum sp. DA384]|uniref:hypothetical protein n=1 Tax=Halalkalibaculum sp. DA384 TaxID=3373606 RepID=UPI0037550E86
MKRMAGKMVLVTVLVVSYFVIWRPVRVASTQHIVKPLSEYILSGEQRGIDLENSGSGVNFSIRWESGEQRHAVTYRAPAGFFFLLAIVSMVFITAEPAYYLYLLAFHLAAFSVMVLFLVAGLHSVVMGFWVLELMNVYLIPVFTMAYIPWLIYLKKSGIVK